MIQEHFASKLSDVISRYTNRSSQLNLLARTRTLVGVIQQEAEVASPIGGDLA